MPIRVQIAALAERHGVELPDAMHRELAALLQPAVGATLDLGPGGGVAPRAPDSGVGVDAEERYEDLGVIGLGSHGEVHRVLDRALNRVMAMKVLLPGLERTQALQRFVEEAQVTAQLQHPGVVPVHDMGRRDDGRMFFTMKEVRGRTLAEIIAEVHGASRDQWVAAASGWTFRRLVTSFHQVCVTVAYAHSLGVIHRDLKPQNVMAGPFGDLLVLDWGLAKVVGGPDPALGAVEPDGVVTRRSADGSLATRMGTVAGTPAYMAPEQARGDVQAVDSRSDVYGLGAILYELLSGGPPYLGSALTVIEQVLAGPPARPRPMAGPRVPEVLADACMRAMDPEPERRHPTAQALADDIEAWLHGSRQRERALAVVARAVATEPEVAAWKEEAAVLRARAMEVLRAVPTWAPAEAKAAGWELQAEAQALEQAADLKELEQEQLLTTALEVAPDLPEAHAALAGLYLARHRAAERTRDARQAARTERRLRHHAEALPRGHAARAQCTGYLRGDGALTLVTDPPGAEVELFRYETRHRRLVEVPVRTLGPTPIEAESLPMGSYLCVLRQPGRAPVRYPIFLPRGAHWDGRAPEGNAPMPVRLPPAGSLGPDDCWVAAGWFVSGGDLQAGNVHPRRRLWCDDLVVRRFPVTNAAYIRFLDDLVARGRTDEALRHAPRERAATAGDLGALLYGRDAEGRFVLQPDADGDPWLPEWPVFHVDWYGATAYAAWEAARTGEPWRLLGELEWEKAARGVDGRFHPWGDGMDPSWCCMHDSHRGRRLPAVVDSYPVDVSPYGVRGLGGNVADWCLDRIDDPDKVQGVRVRDPRVPAEGDRSHRPVRGGAWSFGGRPSRCAFRIGNPPGYRDAVFGIRLGRRVPSSSPSF